MAMEGRGERPARVASPRPIPHRNMQQCTCIQVHLQRQSAAAATQQHHICRRFALAYSLCVDGVSLQHPTHAL